MSLPRVVSLVPSSTETLLALGADVVACTRFCEQPGLPHVGGTKNPDLDAIVALRPDLVVVDREENRREDADALAAAGLEVVATAVRSVADARFAVAELAGRAGVASPPPAPDPGAQVLAPRRRAFVPIWRRPWMSIGPATYGASLLDLLGVDLVTDDPGEPYPTVDLDAVARAEPDVVLVPSEPYDFGDAHLEELRQAVPGATVHRIDGQDLFWWGIRTDVAIGRLGRRLGELPRG